MPILSVQFQGYTPGPGGAKNQIAPMVVLTQKGSVVQVTIAPTDKVVAQLAKKSLPIPAPVQGVALIDTGASMTCIDEQVAVKLGLPVVNVIQMCSASHASHPANVYPATIEMVGWSIKFAVPMAVGAALAPQNLVALIGRDILASCQLVYNGVTGQITLCI